MVRIASWAGALVALAASVVSAVPAAPRLTVVTDSSLALDHYSAFWSSLKDRGYALTFRSAGDSSPSLKENEVLQFDHLLIFAPTTKTFTPELSPQSLISYLSASKNLFIIVSPSLTEYWRDLAREFDIDFDDRGSYAIDHFSYVPSLDDGAHTTLSLSLAGISEPFVSERTKLGAPVLYRGIAHQTSGNPLQTTVLRAGQTAYSYEPKSLELPTDDLFLSGSKLGLVSSFQTRSNARITWVGSGDLFSDEFVNAKVAQKSEAETRSGNLAFINDITAWTFHETGVLKLSPIDLRRASDGSQSSLYRVKEKLALSSEISQLQNGHWVPYTPSSLQFEFTMLDPHLRLPLPSHSSTSNATILSTTFLTPDRHGVFTLLIDYRRAGYTWLKEKLVVSVTPPRHDEYERWIWGAWPYYAGAGSVLVATMGFVVLWVTVV